ncbi:MAG: hypothetical protein O7F12_03295 [Nitrospirae bacterium]|nr:hypothetical protein [Nitrospirota bacterium]
MSSWYRPDPLTRDLIHLINARRHDHGDAELAIDVLQALLEQDREYDILTVLAALDEEMAEWLFDLLAEASCSVVMDGDPDDKTAHSILGALELPLQANLKTPLQLKINQLETAELLRKHLHIPPGTVLTIESRLLTDTTFDFLTLQKLHEHISNLANSQRRQPVAARLHPPVESTAFLLFELIGSPDSSLPETLEPDDRDAIIQGLVAQCPEIAPAPHMLEAPVYAAYAMFDAQNAVRLHRLADETAAVWHDLESPVRSRTIVHLHTQCGNGVYMPVWTDLFDPDLPEDNGPIWTSPDVWVFTADLPIEWPGEMLTNRLLAEGCTRFENHIVEASEN